MLSFTSTRRRVLVIACVATALAGCSSSSSDAPGRNAQTPATSPEPSSSVSVTVVTPAAPVPDLSSTPAPLAIDNLAASFDVLANTLPAGEVGVAMFNGFQVNSYGPWTSGAAWSTIKVPLSIAGLAADGLAAEAAMQQAISQSDNAAAEQLWGLLGDPQTAASAVESVLSEGGNTAVIVESQQVRPPYSPYGQTEWSNDQAAIFAFGLPCVAGAQPVVDQMRNLGGSQQWGLASFADVAAKGGWGPETDGGYLVRQLALVTNSTGSFGVSLAARPANGTFETGQAMLNVLGAWIDRQRNNIVGGHC